ncbi:MAG: family 20 glycosylhydrolase, partial [Phycisphaerales bacterium]|nr:family 20 glycosylhydrolase [Phycisphaerales bacterium]
MVPVTVRDGAMPPEAYELAFTRDGLEVTCGDLSGRRHALTTAAHLLALDDIPFVHVEDAPAFAVRGVMLDVSRDRIPTMEELLDLVDRFAALKINHLQLYTEHTFAYAGHEDVWRGWSPMTPDEIRSLDAHCSSKGIELAANQNCFGHLSSWLRHDRYAHVAETHGTWMFDIFERSGPFSLCPTDERSLEFVRGLLDQLLPCFTSRLVNIGCDETFDVGQGRAKAIVERDGRAAVHARFVNQIARDVLERGGVPMFWADIALSAPEVMDTLPPELISLAWGYEPEAPFAEWARVHEEMGRPFWVCPGTSSWRSFTGRTTERTGNLEAAAGCRGADGFLVTDWGDVGHQQTRPIGLHGIAHGASLAWNPDAPFDASASSFVAFGDAAVGPWLEVLGDVDLPIRRIAGFPETGRLHLANASA